MATEQRILNFERNYVSQKEFQLSRSTLISPSYGSEIDFTAVGRERIGVSGLLYIPMVKSRLGAVSRVVISEVSEKPSCSSSIFEFKPACDFGAAAMIVRFAFCIQRPVAFVFEVIRTSPELEGLAIFLPNHLL